MFKLTIVSALTASALAFGGTGNDCDEICGPTWGNCIDINVDCTDLYTCMAAPDGSLEECGPGTDADVLQAAWETVFACYAECEDDEELSEDFPYLFDVSDTEFAPIMLDFTDGGVEGEATCEGDIVKSEQCEEDQDDDGNVEYGGYYANSEGTIIRLECNEGCSECDWSMAQSMTIEHGAVVGECLCPDHGDDDGGDGGDDWVCVIGHLE